MKRKDELRTEPHKLTDIDLGNLQIGERLTIYRGSNSFLTGPLAAGYVGEAQVIDVMKRGALLHLNGRRYRLRYKDSRICRIPNGEPTMMYVHARHGRPTITAYFASAEYALVKDLLSEEASTPKSSRTHRLALQALHRMEFHDNLREKGNQDED